MNYLAIAVAVMPLIRMSATGKGAVCGNLRRMCVGGRG